MLHAHRASRAALRLFALAGGLTSLVATAAPVSKEVTIAMHRDDAYREHCMQLTQGQTLSFAFTTPRAVEFNLHHHPEHAKDYYLIDPLPVEGAYRGEVAARDAGQHCFMWANTGMDRAHYDIKLAYQVR